MALAGLKLSQRKFAAILSVSPQTVTAWVNADEMPPVARIFLRLADKCGLDVAKEMVKP